MTSRGGSFLTRSVLPDASFTPEDFSEEHRMIRDLARRFLTEEVFPEQESLERQEWDTTVRLLRRAAHLGLLGLEVPQEYGGESLDKVSAMIVAEELASVASFGVSYGGQAGIGTLPIVYFGTEHLKRKYLPALCSGDVISAYALSEASSGSDALAAKTTAVKSPDGQSWILNGEKMWITNAAFADLFITFAQIDGTQFTCFVVEKGFKGVSTGAEERKMGLKGSSTRPLVLDHAVVPAENLLGEIGKGHHVAFNILNIGRVKLGAISSGAGKAALREAVRYAKQRIAFGKPVAEFGAIRQKLAEMAIRTWVVESMVYRTAGLMDAALAGIGAGNASELMAAIRELAVECSILKVFGTEALDYVVDEAVQIHGGYGYSAEYAVERYYRDARVNRIFEGTNEINRLLIAGRLTKQPIVERDFSWPEVPHFAAEQHSAIQARRVFAKVAGAAAVRFGQTLRDEQEILLYLSDLAIDIYAMDCAINRAAKSQDPLALQITQTFVNDAVARIRTNAASALAAVADGDVLQTGLEELHRLMASTPLNTVRSRRDIADRVLDETVFS